ncbi:hypothetical protein [Streptosporangium sp. KLBMP 9127]|nr:hypothetical protein [Streptosporangium sp. KLBMP 9127]
MVVLGLLLMVASAAALVVIFADEPATATTSVSIMDRTYELTQLEVFLAGVATAVIFMLGLMLTMRGMRRTLIHRRDRRRSRAETHNRTARLEAEKRELERKLDETPSTVSGKHAGPVPPPRTSPASPTDPAEPTADDQLVAGRRQDGPR